jgi:hypothetical protein
MHTAKTLKHTQRGKDLLIAMGISQDDIHELDKPVISSPFIVRVDDRLPVDLSVVRLSCQT